MTDPTTPAEPAPPPDMRKLPPAEFRAARDALIRALDRADRQQRQDRATASAIRNLETHLKRTIR